MGRYSTIEYVKKVSGLSMKNWRRYELISRWGGGTVLITGMVMSFSAVFGTIQPTDEAQVGALPT